MTPDDKLIQEQRRKIAYLEAQIEQLKSIPAAEARPVVRGEWAICLRGEMACTNCGARARKRSNFCPNCGADMREKEWNRRANDV